MSTNKVFACGDLHGGIDMSKLNTKNFPEGKTLTKDDFVIVCGDFGLVWDNSNEEKYWTKWLTNKPWTTLFVDGNHEGFSTLNSYPIEEWHGGNIHKINDSIIHLMRGEIYDICGKTFFTMGGASSHDKELRQIGYDWFPEELPNYAEMHYGLDNLEKHGNKVDCIISHCAPARIQHKISPYYENDCLTKYFNEILKDVEYKWWLFGHYHEDKIFEEYQAACLYDKVVRVI